MEQFRGTGHRAHLSTQDSLQPSQASAVLIDRLKHINKVNADIADFLQVTLRAPHPRPAGR